MKNIKDVIKLIEHGIKRTVKKTKKQDNFFKIRKELIKGYPVTLGYTLNNGSKHYIPAYIMPHSKQIYIPYVTLEDAEAIINKDPDTSVEVIIDKNDEIHQTHIVDIDSLRSNQSMEMVEDGNILLSRRFLLALEHAGDRGCNIELITGPII